ncbi:MAG: hypothetical protein IH849_10015 [Acidobacteria bacterium]|nr:hypothetical protein [Acidobacteriota bacterium]
MNEIRLLCIARIDLSCVGPSPDDPYDESLFIDAVPAGPLCWEGLLEVGARRETDDRTERGYVLKAWVIDPIAHRYVHDEEWIDPCNDQWGRLCDYVSDWSQRVEPTPEPD